MVTDTRTALLDVAEHAARAQGFDGFSYADLATSVGIRKASIHYHFPTKAALSTALMDRYHHKLEQALDQIAADNQTAAGRLRALITLYRDALNNGKTLCLCVSLISSRESLTEEVIAKIRAFRAMMVTHIEDIFELAAQDGSISGRANTRSEARATLALLEGAHLSARAEENIETFDQAVDILKSRCQL